MRAVKSTAMNFWKRSEISPDKASAMSRSGLCSCCLKIGLRPLCWCTPGKLPFPRSWNFGAASLLSPHRVALATIARFHFAVSGAS